MTRRQLREQIFQKVFGFSFMDQSECIAQLDISMAELDELALEDEMDIVSEEKDQEYIANKVKAVAENLEAIDATLERNMEGWTLSRIGKVELAILRVAVYEMNYDETVPVNVAINEAVEIAKKYCAEDTKSFVNGILGRIAREA